MKETWRWFGPTDPVTLTHIKQAGASGIVTALHDYAPGEVWPLRDITALQARIEEAGLSWDVCESIWMPDAIKLKGAGATAEIAAWIETMRNLARAGVKTICYNFMPLLDWTRTDLTAPVAGGATCLRFEAVRMAAFEIHMLGRRAAEDDYPTEVLNKAAAWFQQASEGDRDALLASIMAGMPGAFDRYDVAGLRLALAAYEGIDREVLRQNYKRFLDEVVPTAEELGMRLCVHPDDPPRDILSLPRIVSNGDDLGWVLAAHDSPANGVTLCSGSLGANPINNVPAIAARVADRIHFAHLRNVAKDPDGSFEEAAHLTGDTDMVALVRVLLDEQIRRRDAGRDDHTIAFRPDHGHHMLSDHARTLIPGYPLIGRLRGLAELRGVISALSHG